MGDRRLDETRRTLVDTFNELVLTRPYDDIRVLDIIERSGVGRSTFYEHFRNKDAILEHVVRAPLQVLAAAVRDEPGHAARIGELLEHIRSNRERARALLCAPGSAPPVTRALAGSITSHLEAEGTVFVLPVDLVASQIAHAQLALLRGWLTGIEPCPAQDLADGLAETTRSLVAALSA